MSKALNQQVIDNGDFRKYRTELPNLYDDLGLDPYEFRLLAHYKRVCGADGGSTFEGTRKTAEHCNMGVGTVSEARKSLEERDLISLEKFGQRLIVTIEDVWAENFQEYAGGKDNQDGGIVETEGGGETQDSTEREAGESSQGGDEVRAEAREVDAVAKEGRELTDQQLMFQALCDVCRKDYRVISDKDKARIGRVAGKLVKAGYTPEQVEFSYGEGGWWYEHDWRGREGDLPTPEKVQSTIGAARQHYEKRKSSRREVQSTGGRVAPLGG